MKLLSKIKARKLCLKDALILASTVSKYVDVNLVDNNTDAISFVDEIVQKISPDDFLRCIKITTNETEKTLEKKSGIEVLAIFSQGLKVNKIISLLSFYKNIGF